MFSLDVLNSFFAQRYASLGISWFTFWNVFVDGFIKFLHNFIQHFRGSRYFVLTIFHCHSLITSPVEMVPVQFVLSYGDQSFDEENCLLHIL